jgi:hypothetical protein
MRYSVLCGIICAFVMIGCASSAPPTIFMPKESGQLTSFYRNGIPIGSMKCDSATMMMQLGTEEIIGTHYVRVWVLYQNNSTTPYLLEPMKTISLNIVGKNYSFFDQKPEAPSVILSHIDNDKATNLITQAIGGTLQALTVQPTTITNSDGSESKLNDQGEKRSQIVTETAASMASTASMYEVYKSSVNSGILQKNTIFPGESVNGYIYFPRPVLTKDSFGSQGAIDIAKYSYSVKINGMTGKSLVEFNPEVGE